MSWSAKQTSSLQPKNNTKRPSFTPIPPKEFPFCQLTLSLMATIPQFANRLSEGKAFSGISRKNNEPKLKSQTSNVISIHQTPSFIVGGCAATPCTGCGIACGACGACGGWAPGRASWGRCSSCHSSLAMDGSPRRTKIIPVMWYQRMAPPVGLWHTVALVKKKRPIEFECVELLGERNQQSPWCPLIKQHTIKFAKIEKEKTRTSATTYQQSIIHQSPVHFLTSTGGSTAIWVVLELLTEKI